MTLNSGQGTRSHAPGGEQASVAPTGLGRVCGSSPMGDEKPRTSRAEARGRNGETEKRYGRVVLNEF